MRCVCVGGGGGEGGGARMHRTKYYSYSYFSFIQLQIMMLYMLAEYATCIQCSESKESIFFGAGILNFYFNADTYE